MEDTLTKQQPVFTRILKGTFNYGLGNVMGKALGFLLIPVYTYYLTPADYGILDICTTLNTFLIVLFRLGVPGSITRFFFDHRDDPRALNNYVKTVTLLLRLSSLVLGAASALILFFFQDIITKGISFIPYILMTIVLSMIGTNSDVQKRLLQAEEKSAYSAKLNLATIFLSYALAIVCVVGFEWKVLGLLISKIVVAILFVAQASFYLKRFNSTGSFERGMATDSLKYGLGIIPHHIVSALTPFLNRSILIYQGSLTSLGLYSLAYRFVQPLDMLYNMFNLAFQPVFFSMRKQDDFGRISSLLSNIWTGGLVIFSFVILFFPLIIPLVTPVRYHHAAELVPVLSLGFLGQMLYMTFTSELFYNKQTGKMVLISLPGTLVNLAVVAVFVDRYQQVALAWGTSLSLLTMAFLAYIIHARSSSVNYVRLDRIVFGLFMSAILFLAVHQFSNMSVVWRVFAFLGFATIAVFNNKPIITFLKRKLGRLL